MNRNIVHRIVGYDRLTELVAFEYDVPPRHLSYAKSTANVSPQDPDAIGCYPLNRMQARDIAGVIGCHLPNDLDFFLEAFAAPETEPAERREFA